MTPEAADYIRSGLRPPVAGQQLALIAVFRRAEMIDGEERVWFEGKHFEISTYDATQRRNAQVFEVFGQRVSIATSTLESLRGCTLTIRRVPDCSGQLRVLIVAA